MNCATCRGFEPADPAKRDGNAGDGGVVDGGKQLPGTISNPLRNKTLPSVVCDLKVLSG